MPSRFSVLIISVALLFQGCQIFKRTRNIDPSNLKSLKQFEKIYTENLASQQYEWLNASGRIKIKSSNQNISLTAQFKSRKDSLVWARLSKLLEVARAQADVNHFQFINRIDKSFVDYSFNELSAFIDPEQGISAFQNLLMGNIPFDYSEASFVPINGNYSLVLLGDSINQRAIIDNKMLKLTEYTIYSSSGNNEAHATFANYVKTDYGWVPQNIIVKIVGADLELVEIEFSKIEFKKKDKAEFSIPEGYNEN